MTDRYDLKLLSAEDRVVPQMPNLETFDKDTLLMAEVVMVP